MQGNLSLASLYVCLPSGREGRFELLNALRAVRPDKALRNGSEKRSCREIGLNPHVDQTHHGRDRIVGVERREDKMSCQGRLHTDVRRS